MLQNEKLINFEKFEKGEMNDFNVRVYEGRYSVSIDSTELPEAQSTSYTIRIVKDDKKYGYTIVKPTRFVKLDANTLYNIAQSVLFAIREKDLDINDVFNECSELFSLIEFKNTNNESHNIELNDKLDVIYGLQKSLAEYMSNNDKMPLKELVAIANKIEPTVYDKELFTLWIEKHLSAIQSELDEVKRCFNWKWWKDKQLFDIYSGRSESVDILHFLLELMIILGMTPEDIFNEYIDKNRENFDRQKRGY